MTIVGNSGSLSGNSSSTLVVWPSPNNGLALGEYTGQLTISDAQNPTGATTIDVTLIKRAAQASSIVVTPIDPINIPFEIDAGGKNTHIKAFEIRNLGETSIDYSMTSDQYWARVYRLTDYADTTPGSDVILIPVNKLAYSVADLDCPCEIPANGSLPASAAAIVYVRVRVNIGILDQNRYLANLTVTNTTNGLGNTSIPITITPVQINLPGAPEHFKVTRILETNQLVWDLSYVNVQHYEIEHSPDGFSFITYRNAPSVREWDSLHMSLNNLQMVYINDTAGYYYRVRACNTTGCGPYTAIQQAPLEAVVASNWGIVASQDLYSDRIRVRWKSTDQLSSNAFNDGFQLFRSETPTGPKMQLLGRTTQPTDSGYYYYWDTSVQPGQKYYYWIKRCVASSGSNCQTDFSFYAAGVSYRAPANLFASSPGQLSASMFEGALHGLPTSLSLNLINIGMLPAGWSLASDQGWLNPSFTTGALTGDQKVQVGLNVNSAAGLLPVGTHTANLQFTNTTNGAGNYNFEFSLTVQTSPIPEAPGNLASSVDFYSDRVDLEWEAVAGTTFYQITRTAEGQDPLVQNNIDVKFSDSTAAVDVLYQYMVAACNSSGCSLEVNSEGRVILDDDDGDTLNNNFDPDDDNDGVFDEWDKFPLDPTESIDTDNDLVGNNADTDDDNDGVPDLTDLFPFDANDWADNDQDGIGDNADADDDNDGIPDVSDENPFQFDDIEPPVITVPDDLFINSTGLLTEVLLDVAIAWDQIDSSPTVSNDYTDPLPPGIHEIIWIAADDSGNFVTDKQLIHINPLVSIPMTFSLIEGQSLQIPVSLNGDASEYPVVISFSLTGSATENDDYDISPANHIVVIESGRQAVIDLTSRDDAQFELSETIELIIGSDLENAAIGSRDASIITLLQGNIPPTARIGMSQNGQNTRIFTRDEGLVTMVPFIQDLNLGDSHVLDWTRTNVELIDSNLLDEQFSFDPSLLSSGTFNVTLKATDHADASASLSTLIQIKPTAPILTSIDTDGDGSSDEVEGDDDTDSDGIPDYLDRVLDTNRLQSYQADSFVLQADPGLKLSIGDSSFSASVFGARINETDIAQTAGGLYQPDVLNSVGGIFDFNIENLPVAGSSARVVLPLSSPIPELAVYRKYTNAAGWQDFLLDASNQIHSAQGIEGSCPVPGHLSCITGLIPGYWCLQLTLEDGGPNYTDGLINAIIKDPGTVATSEEPFVDPINSGSSNNQEPGSSTGSGSDDSSGGGLLGFYLLILLFSVMIYRNRVPVHRLIERPVGIGK
ncbi:MAG: hypothetical protein ACI8XC_000196 [Gammaproteobacteria bacterium]|jgi:hypothetical protein